MNECKSPVATYTSDFSDDVNKLGNILRIIINADEKLLPKKPVAKAPKMTRERLFELLAEVAESESVGAWTKDELMKMNESEFLAECSEFFPLWFEEVGESVGACGDYTEFEPCTDLTEDSFGESGDVTPFAQCGECDESQTCLQGFQTLENGLTVLGGNVGGAGAESLFVVIFYDGDELKMYVPRYGNSMNADLDCRIGDEWHSTTNSIKLEDDGETVILDREWEFGELISRCPYLAPLMDTPIKIPRNADEELSDVNLRDRVDGEVMRQIISLYLKEQGLDIDAEMLRQCDYFQFIKSNQLIKKDILAAIEVVG